MRHPVAQFFEVGQVAGQWSRQFYWQMVTICVCSEKDRHNQLQHVLTSFDKYESSKDLGEGVIPIHQDCNIYISELDPSVEQEFILAKNRQAYLVCIEGSLSINDNTHLVARDAIEVRRLNP